MLELKNLIIHTHPEVKEDENASLLLLENLDVKRSDEVLLIGIGTGLIPVYTAKRARKVVATDVNQHAIKCAVKNTVVNKAYNVELREGLLFEPVEAEKFDLILFNAHYILDL
ncbi:MAG: methyltransferase, partial [Methanobacteriaceae archaeon]|nr:methyltransferase [Methanobacteriaceae archaeon]